MADEQGQQESGGGSGQESGGAAGGSGGDGGAGFDAGDGTGTDHTVTQDMQVGLREGDQGDHKRG